MPSMLHNNSCHQSLTPYASECTLADLPSTTARQMALTFFSQELCLCRCLDPVLTIVAAQAYGRPLWKATSNKDPSLADAKMMLSNEGSAAKSDHLMIVAAFGKWNNARLRHGLKAAKEVGAFPTVNFQIPCSFRM